jgi:thiol-disulfide isomerase/thioredoxin
VILASLFLLAAPPPPPPQVPPPSGLWQAVVTVDGREVPFRIEFGNKGGEITGSILDGETQVTSTSGRFSQGKLTLRWDYYDATLTATRDNDQLTGFYHRMTRKGPVERPFSAHPYKRPPAAVEAASNVAGDWIVKLNSPGDASAMTARFRQSGSEVTGTIQAVDGDFGVLSGRIIGSALTLSHFDGIRATLLEATVAADNTLTGTLDRTTQFTAARTQEAAAKGLPNPPDPSLYTSVDNSSEPFRFQAPDLDGKMVTSDDPLFQGKVLLVTVMGSWCPNCHDEAPFYEQLYRQYQAQGLEIIALSFEYTGEIERDRAQIRAFNRRHGVTYLTLLAGTTNDGEVQRVLPQLSNFGAFPTTIFVGRDGRPRTVHAGFSGPATGSAFELLKVQITNLVRVLLAETAPSQ